MEVPRQGDVGQGADSARGGEQAGQPRDVLRRGEPGRDGGGGLPARRHLRVGEAAVCEA